jgi:hypothetical protein
MHQIPVRSRRRSNVLSEVRTMEFLHSDLSTVTVIGVARRADLDAYFDREIHVRHSHRRVSRCRHPVQRDAVESTGAIDNRAQGVAACHFPALGDGLDDVATGVLIVDVPTIR